MNLLYLADIRFPMERANGIQTIETCHALARAGVGVELVVRRSDSRSDASCLDFFGLDPHPRLSLRRLFVPAPGSLLGRAAFAGQCLSPLLSGRFDAVYTRDLALADLALRARRYHGLPVLYEAHTAAAIFSAEATRLYQEFPPTSPRKLERLKRRERRVCRKAAALVTITRELLRCLEDLHAPLAPAHVIPDGTRITRQAPPPRARAEGEPVRVVYIGHLYPWKGVAVLIRSMQHLPDVELVIIGGLPPEPDLERTRALAEQLGVSQRVRFRGYLSPPQLPEERLQADIFAIPLPDSTTARLFTSPLKLFEAMAAGRPIVASDLPSIREVLTHEVNALLVPPGDPHSLAEAIRKLADDQVLGDRLAARAAHDVKKYSWDERARKLSIVLLSALGSCAERQ